MRVLGPNICMFDWQSIVSTWVAADTREPSVPPFGGGGDEPTALPQFWISQLFGSSTILDLATLRIAVFAGLSFLHQSLLD